MFICVLELQASLRVRSAKNTIQRPAEAMGVSCSLEPCQLLMRYLLVRLFVGMRRLVSTIYMHYVIIDLRLETYVSTAGRTQRVYKYFTKLS